jgi:hypothetical protein
MRDVNIKLYAQRNEIVHSNPAILIRQGRFHDLGRQRNDDYCDTPRIVPVIDSLQ